MPISYHLKVTGAITVDILGNGRRICIYLCILNLLLVDKRRHSKGATTILTGNVNAS